MAKILIIEDEEKIARFVELELRHEGYETRKSGDGREGLELGESGDFDLILLDIMLPGLTGLEVLRRLRRASSVPVILLTARDSVTDKVAGLDMGANDYITKPFAIEELLARIRVTLRNAVLGDDGRQENNKIFTCGELSLNADSHEVSFAGKPVELTNREFVLLKTLLENPGVVMTRERLLSEAWGYDYYGETNIVDVYVRYIRNKTSPDLIRTVRGVGYRIADGGIAEPADGGAKK